MPRGSLVALLALMMCFTLPVSGSVQELLAPEPTVQTFADLTQEQWKSIQQGEQPAMVDIDYYPIGDANGDGLEDVWQAAFGQDPVPQVVVTGTGREIWSREPRDDEFFLAVGDINRDDVMDFGSLSLDGEYTYELYDGRDLSLLGSLKAPSTTMTLAPGFTLTFFAFPTPHPYEDGLLFKSGHYEPEGGYIVNSYPLIRYGHEGGREDLTVQHMTFAGETLWSQTFGQSYTTHFSAGYIDAESDGQVEMLVAAVHDPDQDHLEVLGERPLDEEPEESITMHLLNLADGSTRVLATIPGLPDSFPIFAIGGDVFGNGPTVLMSQWGAALGATGVMYNSQVDMIAMDGTTPARLIDDGLWAGIASDDVDGDGLAETYLLDLLEETTILTTGAFEEVWSERDVFPLGLDINADGVNDLGRELENDDETITLEFLNAVDRSLIWAWTVDINEVLDIDIVPDMNQQGGVDFLLTEFPGASDDAYDEFDGYVSFVRGLDGNTYWTRHFYEADAADFPRLSTHHYQVGDMDGDDAPDLLLNFEFIPRMTGGTCNNSGCTYEYEEGELFNIAIALDGVHASRLLRQLPATPGTNVDEMSLDGVEEGPAGGDLEKAYTPAAPLLFAILGICMLAMRRR